MVGRLVGWLLFLLGFWDFGLVGILLYYLFFVVVVFFVMGEEVEVFFAFLDATVY